MKKNHLIVWLLLSLVACKENSFEGIVEQKGLAAIYLNQNSKETYTQKEEITSLFLGNLTDKHKTSFYIINSIHSFTNRSGNRNSTSYLMVYDNNKKNKSLNFIGYYPIAFPEQLPNKIKNNKLVFNTFCEDNRIMDVSFENGTPHILRLGCNHPDDYEFVSMKKPFNERIETINQNLIKKNKVNKFTKYRHLQKETITTLFLGSLTDKNKNIFLIVNSTYSTKINKIKTNKRYILIYSKNHNNTIKFIGAYGLLSSQHFPNKIKNNKLIFNTPCKYNNIINVNFENGIPHLLNLGCSTYKFIKNDI